MSIFLSPYSSQELSTQGRDTSTDEYREVDFSFPSLSSLDLSCVSQENIYSRTSPLIVDMSVDLLVYD